MFRFSLLNINWKVSFNLFVENASEFSMALLVLLLSFFLTDKNISNWLTEERNNDIYDLLKLFIGYSVGCLWSRCAAFFDERKLTSSMVKNSNLSKFDKINATIYANWKGTEPAVYFVYWDMMDTVPNTNEGSVDKGWGRKFQTKDNHFSLLETVKTAEAYIKKKKKAVKKKQRPRGRSRRRRIKKS